MDKEIYYEQVREKLKNEYNWEQDPDKSIIEFDFSLGLTVEESCETFGDWNEWKQFTGRN